ncbi:hypothetical protein [Morganella sp. EGD-HP17]|uniref:hypothetical protein n=1 Tax=Morganella sp. EGD-HP17 TaxID=1435146 RepID=UPI0004015910|nr:hypothetical protein [Morganella sp. EGD-HP17]ETO41255.1 hypothetical protein X965_11040 [Morganella sp. EGD-HP17]
MKFSLQMVLKFLCVTFIATNNYAHAEAGQFVGVTMKNNMDDKIYLEKFNMWERRGSLPDNEIQSHAESYAHSKGQPLRGTGGIYVYKLEDGLYLDMLFRQDHYGDYEYQVCLSDRARIKFTNGNRMYYKDYNKQNPDGQLICVTDSSKSKEYLDKKFLYEDVSVLVQVKTAKSGAFNLYNSKYMTITVDNSNCKGNPVYQSATFRFTKKIPTQEAIYAMYDGCLYYNYCPPKSDSSSENKLCEFERETNFYTGNFYPVSSDIEIVSLFRDLKSSMKQNDTKFITYNNKPGDRGFVQRNAGDENIRVGRKIPATELRRVMDEVDKQYCDYISSKNKNSVCHNITYAMQPRIANQLKYIDEKHLDKYSCYVSSLTYPNIGSNICQLTKKYTISDGVIVSR